VAARRLTGHWLMDLRSAARAKNAIAMEGRKGALPTRDVVKGEGTAGAAGSGQAQNAARNLGALTRRRSVNNAAHHIQYVVGEDVSLRLEREPSECGWWENHWRVARWRQPAFGFPSLLACPRNGSDNPCPCWGGRGGGEVSAQPYNK